MADSGPLTVEEIVKLRDWVATRPDTKERRYMERLCATLEALMAERDEWHAAADEWARAYEEAIGG